MIEAEQHPGAGGGAGRRSATTQRRGALHAALVAAAERNIAAEGVSAVKARALAEAAGCSVGAIYNVVADLDALILEANARTLAAIDATLRAAASGAAAADPAARLCALAIAYLDEAARHTSQWSALFAHRMSGGNPVPDWYLAQQAAMFTHVEAPLAQLRPDMPVPDLELLARSLFSAVHGMVSLGLSGTLTALPLDIQRSQLRIVTMAIVRGLSEGKS
jgi:AcrR family transcriptional regulator